MKADVVKKAQNVTDNITKGCAGQKVSEQWCVEQDDSCQKKRMCGRKCGGGISV